MSEPKYSILLVDDDEVDRLTVKRALKKARFLTSLTEVDNGQKAIASLKVRTNNLASIPEINSSSQTVAATKNSFDLILLDYRLPDIDGLHLIGEIKALNIDLPIIVLTGQGDEELAVEIMKSGAVDYLSK